MAEALFAGAGTTLDDAQRTIDASGKPAPLVLTGARLEATADLTPKRSLTRNVIGLLSRASTAAEAVVVGAHYDHLGLGATGSLDPAPDGKIHHGADDNASGVAGVLELARRFAAPNGAGSGARSTSWPSEPRRRAFWDRPTS